MTEISAGNYNVSGVSVLMSSREAAHLIYFSFSVESHFTLQHIRDISLQCLTNRQLTP